MAVVALVGTLDTKGPDFAFLAGRLRSAGVGVIVVNAGTGEPAGLDPDIDGETVAETAGVSRAGLRATADRGRAVTGEPSHTDRPGLTSRASRPRCTRIVQRRTS